MKKYVLRSVCAVALAGALAGCGGKKDDQAAASKEALGEQTGSAAGVNWHVPKRWTLAGERPMRVATYVVPPSEEETEAAECAVSFFGTGQGGDVQSNISRWIGQFEDPGKPEQDSREVNGLPVSTVHVTGTYLSPGGPMMQSTGKREGFGMLGAIVEAPDGMLFFKLTGPAAAVSAARGEFHAMLSSLTK